MRICLRNCATLSLLLAAAAAGPALAQQMPADLDPASGARLPHLTRADLGDDGKRLADIFARNGGPTDTVGGPLAFAAYNVRVANALLDLHDGAIGGTLDPRARELAIMVACRETNYSFEWNGHRQAAINAGVDPKVIDIVRDGKRASGLADRDEVIIRFGRELIGDKNVSSETFAEVVELYGEHGAMDIVAVMMTYAVSGYYAIAVDEHPPGQEVLEPLQD